MDRRLRELQRRAAQDPTAKDRYTRELIRSGRVEECLETICDVSELYLKNVGGEEFWESNYKRREILSKVADCTKLGVFVVIGYDDEGDGSPDRVFVSEDQALKWVVDLIMEQGEYIFDDETANDFQLLYNGRNFRDIMREARFQGIDYSIHTVLLSG
jgi:hypothetical protein